MHLGTDLVGQHFPAGPVGLVHAVFDGDDRVTLGQARQVVGKTFGAEYLAFASQIVLTVLEELAGSAVQGQGHVFTQLVTSVGDGFGNSSQSIFVGGQVRRETTFVTHGGIQATGFEHGFQVMEDFGTHTQGVGKVLGTDRLHHELLDIDVVVRVFTAVDDVHHRHRHRVDARSTVKVGDVCVQRHALGLGSGFGGGQGYGENGVSAKRGLVLGAVEFDHGAVESLLVKGVFTQQQVADRAIDVGYGLEHALAQVTALVAITQFQRFTRTGGSTGRRAGAADDTAFEDYIGFYGGVATGVENLTALDVDDFCHRV